MALARQKGCSPGSALHQLPKGPSGDITNGSLDFPVEFLTGAGSTMSPAQ